MIHYHEYHNLFYMKEKDKNRQKNIEEFLHCNFIRIRKIDFLKNPTDIIDQLKKNINSKWM